MNELTASPMVRHGAVASPWEYAPGMFIGVVCLLALMLLMWALLKSVPSRTGSARGTLADRLLGKSVGELLLGCVAGVVLPAFVAGYYCTPQRVRVVEVEKVVEKPVDREVKVPDTAAVDRLNTFLRDKERAIASLQVEKSNAESRVVGLRSDMGSVTRQMERADARIAELNRQLATATSRLERYEPKPLDPRDKYVITAFGERRSVASWVGDLLCKVDEAELRKRIDAGWPNGRKLLELSKGSYEATQIYDDLTAAAERKREAELERRRALPDRDLSKEPNYKPPVVKQSEAVAPRAEPKARSTASSLSLSIPSPPPPPADHPLTLPPPPPPPAPSSPDQSPSDAALTLFGERKTISDWARDPICAVSETVLRRRLSQGWTARRAVLISDGTGYAERRLNALSARRREELEVRRTLPDFILNMRSFWESYSGGAR